MKIILTLTTDQDDSNLGEYSQYNRTLANIIQLWQEDPSSEGWAKLTDELLKVPTPIRTVLQYMVRVQQ